MGATLETPPEFKVIQAPGPLPDGSRAGDGPGCCQAPSPGERPGQPCCGPPIKPRPPQDPLGQPFVVGALDTPAGKVPQVISTLSWSDEWGTIKARWGVGRMSYTVEPGLYALGRPGPEAPVLVTANYKMSFDRLRRAMAGQEAWLLVLETFGINVWCAAGKGTFGTEELARRIKAAHLEKVVCHREVILPQLSAPGVAAFRIKKLTGFKALYGPIRAEDLPAFLEAGKEATPRMRRKDFPLGERTALIPVELVEALKYALPVAAVMFLLSGLGGGHGFWSQVWTRGFYSLAGLLTAVAAGTVLTPLLLPWLPGRAFGFKGAVAGLAAALVLAVFISALYPGNNLSLRLEVAGWLLLIPACSAFLGMNFTGASTYTSLSGVKKEMRQGIPLQIAAGAIGLGLWLAAGFTA